MGGFYRFQIPLQETATPADTGGHHFVGPIYILTLLRGAYLGQNAKFLLSLQSKNLEPPLIRPGSREF